jgi:hypothetical protein
VVLYVHKDLEAWAFQALKKAGYDVTRVYRVYQPKHPADGDTAEVLYEENRKACTALLEPTGRVVVTLCGW